LTKLKNPEGRHTVMLKGIAIGYSEQVCYNASLGRARGQRTLFVTERAVQPVFKLYTDAVPTPGGEVSDEQKLGRYHKSRDALQLSLEDDAGQTVRTTAIHIADYTHLNRGTIEVEALISDSSYWKKRVQ